jgi:hypothetical protein
VEHCRHGRGARTGVRWKTISMVMRYAHHHPES